MQRLRLLFVAGVVLLLIVALSMLLGPNFGEIATVVVVLIGFVLAVSLKTHRMYQRDVSRSVFGYELPSLPKYLFGAFLFAALMGTCVGALTLFAAHRLWHGPGHFSCVDMPAVVWWRARR